MALTVGELVAYIQLDRSDFKRGLAEVDTGMKGMQSSATATTAKVERDTSTSLQRMVRDAQGAWQTMARDMGSAGTGGGRELVRGLNSALSDIDGIAGTAGRNAGASFVSEAAEQLRTLRYGEFDVDVDVDLHIAEAIATLNSLEYLAEQAGVRAGDGFVRGADGRLRDARGRFVSEGKALFDELGDGAERAGGMITNALGGALDTLSATGPGKIAIVGGAIAALPTIAQAAASGIVFALGAGLATVGLKQAAQAEEVQDAWRHTATVIKAELRDAAEPLEGSAIKAADVALRAFEKIKPHLANIWRDLAPDIDHFVKMTGDALSKIGPRLEKIGKSFGDMLANLGDEMPAIIDQLTGMMTDLTEVMDENPRLLADLIKDGLEFVRVGGQVVGVATDISNAVMSAFDPTQAQDISFIKAILGDSPEEVMAQSDMVHDSFVRAMAGVQQAIADAKKAASESGEGFTLMGMTAADAAKMIDELSSAVDELTGLTTNAINAEIDYKRTLDQVRASVKENGEATNLNTEAGRKNKEALIELADSANNYRKALIEQGTPMDEVEAKLKSQRAAFLATAEATGLSKKEANDLAAALGLIPGGVKTDVKTHGGAEALDLIKKYRKQLEELDGKVINTTVRIHQDGSVSLPGGGKASIYEAGGIHEYAAGGVEAYAAGTVRGPRPGPHVASRPTVLFGEGNGPEAYIPYESKHRSRAIDLLSQVADDFGLAVFNKRAQQSVEQLTYDMGSSADQINAELRGAVAVMKSTLGDAGSLTGSINQVGETGESMIASWLEGSSVLGNAVTGMSGIMADSIVAVGVSVDGLAGTTAELIATIDRAMSSTSIGTDDGPIGASAKETRGKRGKGKKGKSGIGASASETRGNLKDRIGASAHEERGSFGGLIDGSLPGFARGGIIDRPTLAWLAENGPEAVIPLNNWGRAMDILGQAGALGPSMGSSAAMAHDLFGRGRRSSMAVPAPQAYEAGGGSLESLQRSAAAKRGWGAGTGAGAGPVINVDMSGSVIREEADIPKVVKGFGMEYGLRAPAYS